MGAIGMLTAVLMGSLCLCGVYSGLDMKYGDKGFLCWGAFSVLATVLSGGPFYAAAAVGLIAAGKAFILEPFTVLLVSLLTSILLYKYFCRDSRDDVQVVQRPFEQAIREILFRHDPSHLHLVDSELDRYRGREKQLLREYQTKFAPTTGSSRTVLGGGVGSSKTFGDSFGASFGANFGDSAADYGRDAGAAHDRRTALQRAHDEETRRVQETIRASVERITARADRRR